MLTYATEKVKVQLVIPPLLSHDCLDGGYERLAEQPIHAHPPLGLLHILGHDVCQLQRGRDLPQDEVSILDGLVSKVLADIDFVWLARGRRSHCFPIQCMPCCPHTHASDHL